MVVVPGDRAVMMPSLEIEAMSGEEEA